MQQVKSLFIQLHHENNSTFDGGKTYPGSSRRIGKIYNPATGEQSAQVKLASTEDVNKAIDNAKKVFESWSNTPPLQRARVMFKFKVIEKIQMN